MEFILHQPFTILLITTGIPKLTAMLSSPSVIFSPSGKE
jgi:hypothetical protein